MPTRTGTGAVAMLSGRLAKFKGEIAHLVEYHPYWIYDGGSKTRNPAADQNTYLIMDLKGTNTSKRATAVRHFVGELDSLVASNVAFTVVPSHDPAKLTTGVRLLAQALAERKNRVDATACLVRHTLVDKKSGGGDRSLAVDLRSIRVEQPELLTGGRVVLLDDVTTSGNSFEACRRLLLKAGAAEVQCLAVGKTVR
ncbi:MAG: hypothetical protein FLDDKLPJ_03687 [Phycisphaerae bacterium]|nr:hypothetical protein [Phycisphaerae bacterium]